MQYILVFTWCYATLQEHYSQVKSHFITFKGCSCPLLSKETLQWSCRRPHNATLLSVHPLPQQALRHLLPPHRTSSTRPPALSPFLRALPSPGSAGSRTRVHSRQSRDLPRTAGPGRAGSAPGARGELGHPHLRPLRRRRGAGGGDAAVVQRTSRGAFQGRGRGKAWPEQRNAPEAPGPPASTATTDAGPALFRITPGPRPPR